MRFRRGARLDTGQVAVYRDFVRRDLLDLRIFTEGNHRLQLPSRDGFVSGYLDAISSFVAAQLR